MCLFRLCIEVTLLCLGLAAILKTISEIEMCSVDCSDNDIDNDDDDNNNNNNNNNNISIQHFTPYLDCLPLLLCKYNRRV